jgi:hypothetical protein
VVHPPHGSTSAGLVDSGVTQPEEEVKCGRATCGLRQGLECDDLTVDRRAGTREPADGPKILPLTVTPAR